MKLAVAQIALAGAVVIASGATTARALLPAGHLAAVNASGPANSPGTSSSSLTLTQTGSSTGSSKSVQVLGLTISASPTAAQNSNSNSNSSSGNVLTDSRNGLAILSGSGMVPGGPPVSGSVTLSIQGQASSVSLSESNLVSKTCAQNNLHCTGGTGTGNLAGDLALKVVDSTTAKTVYQGPLNGLGQPQPVQICGVGSGGSSKGASCATWANKESHTFTFTVTFPNGNANAYEGTSASVEFDWTRV